jgi:DNA (cytosine-5)-methyltransferase 1
MCKNKNFNLNHIDFTEAIKRFSKVNIKDFKPSKPLKHQLKVGSLFAGVGGIDLGFIKAGFNISWANEIDKDSCLTYKSNFGDKIICKDITKLTKKDINDIDILTGGFPCQAFSVAGYRKGFQDERGAIFFELMRLVKELKPKILFLENVKNLKTHNNGKTFHLILKSIEKEGYFIKYQIINTCEFSDLPQNRERLYIVCFKNKKTYNNFKFPKKKKNTQSITDILEKNIEEKFYYTKSRYYSILKKEIIKKDTCYQWRRHYVRENKSNLCPTLTANMGTGGHNVPLVLDSKDIRKLTPRECARLQGFPDTFIFPETMAISKAYKQIGNSVSVPIITKIAKNIMLALKDK